MLVRCMSPCVMIVRDEHDLRGVLDGGVQHLLHRHRRAQVLAGEAPLLEAAVLDVDDLAHAHRVLVLAHRGGDALEVLLGDEGSDLLVGEQLDGLGGMTSVGRVDGHVQAALDLDERALGGVHDLLVDDLAVVQVHGPAELERGGLGDALARPAGTWSPRPAVAGPLDLGLDEALLAQLGGLREAHVDVVLGVELVDERHLVGVAQRAAADEVAGLVGRDAAPAGEAAPASPYPSGRWFSPKWWQTGAR